LDFNGKVVMLTGAAGTGKSALASECAAHLRPLYKVDFGNLLLQKLQERDPSITYEQPRTKSSEIISADLVRSTDEAFIQSLAHLRLRTNVLLDSHAVNREEYGYRITHYSSDDLRRIAFDAVFITYCDPDIWRERRERDPQGRRKLSRFEAQHFMALQEAVGIHYAITCGCPCYLLDTSDQTPADLLRSFKRYLQKIGAMFEV
jgi:adenylate kinase